jgi:hypothetical protein
VIHLEGMGILGSLLAWRLARAKVRFTWHDTDEPICAWMASTGCIYPSGDPFDRANYKVWARWAVSPPWDVDGCVEITGWWYCSKAPPHGAKDFADARVGSLTRGTSPSFHFNAQRFVVLTREKFAAGRRGDAPAAGRRVVTHGFGPRLHHWVWGWSRRVRLRISAAVMSHEFHPRPSIYLRRGRFVMAYAYAVPGTEWWYAGSSLIVQKGHPRHLEMPAKYERWKKNVLELSGGLVDVEAEGEFVEGWRPAAAPEDSALVRKVDGNLMLKPLWNSGIRHAPAVMDAAMEALQFQ